MTIVMITHNDLSVSEGPVTHFTELAQNLQNLGHRIVAFAPNLTGVRKEWPFAVTYLNCFSRKPGLSQLLYELVLIRALWRVVKRDDVDVIYSRQSYITLTAPLIARLTGIPLATEVNGILADDLEGRNVGWLRKRVNRFCERFAYSRSGSVICVSNRIRDAVADTYDVPLWRLVTFSNGVNTDHFQPRDASSRNEIRKRLGIEPDEFCIGYVGCFTPFDGIEQMPEVAQRLTDGTDLRFKVVLVGDEVKKKNVEALIKENGNAGQFILTGRIDYSELPAYLTAFDIGVAPYVLAGNGESPGRPIGNDSLKCLEYSAMALPVVASKLPQTKYIVESRSGQLVPPGELDMFVSGIHNLMQTTPERRREMGQRGRAYVCSKRSWRQVAQRTDGALRDVCACASSTS